MPFGWAGVLSGAASCFWAFSGFELISCAVEESHAPQRHIPLATLLTVLIVTALYIGTSAGMTLLIPCQLLDTGAPLPSAFVYAGLSWGRYVIVLGPLCGFTTAFISSTFGFVRISLAMAEDGLLCGCFANVSKFSQVPVLSVIVCGLLESVIACFCDISDLISFNVNILLLSYTSTCVAVIVLRYSAAADDETAAGEDLNLSPSICPNSSDAREPTSDFDWSNKTVSQHNTDTQKSSPVGNEGSSSSDSTFDNDRDTEQLTSMTSNSEDGPSYSLLDDDAHSAGARSLLPRCSCLEPFMICESHSCIRASLALMLMSMLGLALILVYCIVPLESGLWWSVVLVAVALSAVAFFLCIISIHRQTLQTAVLKVSIIVEPIANCN